jgi:hypothetical protein
MKIAQITKATDFMKSIGINIDEFEPVELGVNLCETIQLVFLHKTKNIKIVVEDPTNHPNRLEIDHLD